jgi:hypothetical protein
MLHAMVLFISESTWIFCWYMPTLCIAASIPNAISLTTPGRRRRLCATVIPKSVPAMPYVVTWMLDFSRSLPDHQDADLDVSHKANEKQKERILALQAQVQSDACERVTRNPAAALVFEHGIGFDADPISYFATFCPQLGVMMNTGYYAAATFGDTRIFLRNDR